jgi:hypothetical protein
MIKNTINYEFVIHIMILTTLRIQGRKPSFIYWYRYDTNDAKESYSVQIKTHKCQ